LLALSLQPASAISSNSAVKNFEDTGKRPSPALL